MDELIGRLRAYIAQREKILDGGITITECNGVPLTITDLREAITALEAAREDAGKWAILSMRRGDWLELDIAMEDAEAAIDRARGKGVDDA